MQLDPRVMQQATARIERAHGARLIRPAAAAGAAPPAPRPDRWARVARYIADTRTPLDVAALERAIGTNDLLSIHYFWGGLRAARAVGRIVSPPTAGDPGGYGTGFLVAPGLLMTNHHVFKTAEIARPARVQFGYEAAADGSERPSTWFAFAPDRFFLADEHLDYCLVAVDPATQQGPDALPSFGWLRLNARLGKTDYGQYLSIIQHPGGEPKQVAIRENELLPFEDADDFLTYTSDTFRGSSGSPVFNDFWDVVALHHSGKAKRDAEGHYIGHDGKPILDRVPREDEILWEANEGARASRIVADALARAAAGEAREALEAACNGTARPDGVRLEAAAGPAGAQPAAAGALPPVELRGLEPGPRSFFVVLPLDVSVRVESAVRAGAAPPAPAAPAAAGTPAAPARAGGAGAGPGLTLEKLNFDTDYGGRRGYDDRFLGQDRPAPMPTIDPARRADVAPTLRNARVLHYHHFSAVIHARRRMPVLSAGNVDYRASRRDDRVRADFGTDQWMADARMDAKYQIPKGFYDRWKRLDYGHLVRRDDNCWGASAEEIEFSNADTFHLTNCTPQHEAFNRAVFGFHGLWGELEKLIGDQAQRDRTIARLSVFAGPIFNDTKDPRCDDGEAGVIRVPLAFWKVVVAPTTQGGLRAYGFITSQAQDLADDPPFEDFRPAAFKDEQAALSAIEQKTIVRFGNALKAIDVMLTHPGGNELAPLRGLDEVWLGRR